MIWFYSIVSWMRSKVFYIDLRATLSRNIPQKLSLLFSKANFPNILKENDLVACKVHFGERGTTAFIRPVFVQTIIQLIKESGAKPFLTDTNTLYVGNRMDAQSHLTTAILNGFTFANMGVPIIIADGLRGQDGVDVEIDKKHFNKVRIASSIYYADAMIVLSHCTGHILTGFACAIKNLGMGCATREGKLKMHSTVSPWIYEENCNGCGTCIKWCPANAISLQTIAKTKKAKITTTKCIGCAACIGVCPQKAIKVSWDEDSKNGQEKIVEYAFGAIKGKPVGYINFLTDVTPLCDCPSASDAPIVPNIGILASNDPVAIDQASYDLINEAPSMKNSAVKGKEGNKFKILYPEIDPEIQLRYGEEIGLGTRNYELIKIK